MSQHHVIYVPGLGGLYPPQRFLIQRWRRFGVVPHFFPSRWADKEDYGTKLVRLLTIIDRHAKNGHDVSLVGVSAGASLALNAYDKKKNRVKSVVTICGKIQNPEDISDKLYQSNPAFRPAMEKLQHTLADMTEEDKSNVLTMRPLHDSVVPVQDQVIDGTESFLIRSKGHIYSVAVAITTYARVIVNFIKA